MIYLKYIIQDNKLIVHSYIKKIIKQSELQYLNVGITIINIFVLYLYFWFGSTKQSNRLWSNNVRQKSVCHCNNVKYRKILNKSKTILPKLKIRINKGRTNLLWRSLSSSDIVLAQNAIETIFQIISWLLNRIHGVNCFLSP